MARARGGVAVDRVLIYGAAGGGYGGGSEQISAPGVSSTTSNNRPLWTVGGGIEGAVLPNLLIRAEYLYVQTFDTNSTIGAVTITNHVSDSIARVGLSYKFMP